MTQDKTKRYRKAAHRHRKCIDVNDGRFSATTFEGWFL